MDEHTLPIFNHICVIGLGLIGASFVQAVHDANQHAIFAGNKALVGKITAVDTNVISIQNAISSGIIAEGGVDIKPMVSGADLVMIATPVKTVAAVMSELKAAIDVGILSTDAVISDVGSTKVSVALAAESIFGSGHHFIGGHPIAGAENSGFDARDGCLFVKHKLILCPALHSRNNEIVRLARLWQAIGAEVIQMDAARHDEILAYTSHLPHLLAFGLTYQLASHDDNLDIFRYAAGGFRDFSRIAASHPVMWHDIFIANKTELLNCIDEFLVCLTEFRTMIDDENSKKLFDWLNTARHARRHFGHMLNTSSIHSSDPSTMVKKSQSTTIMQNTNAFNMDTSNTNQSYHIHPSRKVGGVITVPGDKSISHRSIMFGSLADGVTRVQGFLQGEDALATLQAFRDMGVKIDQDGDRLTIYGVGMDGLQAPKNPLYMGNSGTSMRLLAGILSAQKFDSVMTGDVSLSKRPMERVASPLRLMGAKIQTTGERGTAPISILGGQALSGIQYDSPVASAQVKSCLTLASLWAAGTTIITEPEISRDHTERMLKAFGYPIIKTNNTLSITGGGRLIATDIVVPADISSAAFFMVLGLIGSGEGLTIQKVGMNPTRTGVIDILKLMGASINITNQEIVGGEPIADITVYPSNLKGIDIPEHLVPLAIDEFPVLFIAASCAIGQTRLTGAKELRVKESDRIAVMAEGLATLGVDCTVLEDGMVINGKDEPTDFTNDRRTIFGGGRIQSHHDHRIAMSFAVASVRADDDIIIDGTQTVATSFPEFATLANKVGLNINVQSSSPNC